MRRKLRRNGYTLLELCVTLVIISITAAILFPVVSNCRDGKPNRAQCMSNLKQIGVAVLQYAQNNDETLPPAAAVDKRETPRFSRRENQNTVYYWFGRSEISPASGFEQQASERDGALELYFKSHSVYWCADLVGGKHPLYMTSDLAGGAKMPDLVNPPVTVLVMDGEDAHLSVGHAFNPGADSLMQIWNPAKTKLLLGAAVGKAASRHGGGADYLFADGHVHWLERKHVFFPSRNSRSPAHLYGKTDTPFGPDPAQNMAFNGYKYSATFHLR